MASGLGLPTMRKRCVQTIEVVRLKLNALNAHCRAMINTVLFIPSLLHVRELCAVVGDYVERVYY